MQVATHDAAEYSAEQNVWVAKAPLFSPRFRFAAAYASGTIYAFGGAGTGACLEDLCDDRGISLVEGFADISYPSVFVYQRK